MFIEFKEKLAMNDKKPRPYKHPQINLRIPEELKAKIQKVADENNRSMNAEIVSILDRYIIGLEKYDNNIDAAYLAATHTREYLKETFQQFTTDLIQTLKENLEKGKVIVTSDELRDVLLENDKENILPKKGE